MWLYILLGLVAATALCIFVGAIVSFKIVFYSPSRKPLKKDEFEIPPGKVYESFREEMVGWVRMTRGMEHQKFEIKSYDGLTLRGRYYECDPEGPIELLFHGYRGNAERDLSGGVARCFELGRNALIIDQRASGTSDGRVITFGIREHRDCLSWVDFAVSHFGKERKLILTGISMGAATVLMAAGKELPPNVVCVLADCGYSSPKEIIKKVIADLKLPVWFFYPIVKLAALMFGFFRIEKYSPMEGVKNSRVPIIFIHGDTDDFVPCDMSRKMYESCTSEQKTLVEIEGAGHGLAFPHNQEAYLEALRKFQEKCGF